MHLLLRALVGSKPGGGTESKRKGRKPKLERCNALRNADYDVSSSSTSSLDDSASLRTRSVDMSLLGERTSFRVEGSDGLDRICRSLGLSGPEDFEIPAAEWDSMKAYPSSDMFPTFRLCRIDGDRNQEPQEKTPLEVQDLAGIRDSTSVCGTSEATDDGTEFKACSIVGGTAGGSGSGLKGLRPPRLAPPLPILLSAPDTRCSDALRSSASENDDRSSFPIPAKEEVDGLNLPRADVRGLRFGETTVLSDSCSFSPSNDDDSSSTTTEPMSNNSPVDRFAPGITYWEKGGLLGRGTFGSVYEGIADGGFFFAVKEVSLLEQGNQGKQSVCQLEQEIALLSKFQHANIVRYLGTYRDESKFCIFLELVSKGSLQKLYQSYNLRDFHVSSYTRQILQGLKYLHEQNVVHRDIKCANILVDVGGTVKLADFGLAKVTKFNDVKSCKGTPFWMAPEVVKNRGYGLTADIWSLGCTVLEMLTRQIPYSHLEGMSALYKIGCGDLPRIPSSLSRDARDFILQCLQVDPARRPTADQLLDHPFINRPPPASFEAVSPQSLGRGFRLAMQDT